MFDSLGHWYACSDNDPRLVDLFSRHYSARQWRGRQRWLRYGIVGPGEKLCLLTTDGRAGFAWLNCHDDLRLDGQTGANCTFFRNEGELLSSVLVEEAVRLARVRWPVTHFYTYVDATAVSSRNPGYCFKMAGWRQTGKSKKGLILLEFGPNS